MSLQRILIDGAMASVAYLTGLGGEFVDPADASIAVAKFDDGRMAYFTLGAPARALGGPGSGFHGHAGRPGHVGGSAQAVTDYVGDSAPINNALRAGRPVPRGYQATVEQLDAAFAAAPTLSESQVFYRAVPLGDTHAPGVDKAFISTSRNSNFLDQIADEGIDPSEYRLITIRAEKGTPFIDVNRTVKNVHFREQNEVLFPRGLDVTYDGDVMVLRPGKRRALGGPGSGNFDHAGRPGKVGGSAPKSDATDDNDYPPELDAIGSSNMTEEDALRGRDFIDANDWAEQQEDKHYRIGKKDGTQLNVMEEPITEEIFETVVDHEDLRVLVTGMTEEIPGDLAVTISPQGDRIAVRVTRPGDTFVMERQIYRDKNGTLMVEHHLLTIPKAQQNSDLAKGILRGSMNAYERVGVDRLSTLANIKTGGYAWARFGFTATDSRDFGYEVTLRLGRSNLDLTDDDRVVLKNLVAGNMDNPQLPWLVADTLSQDGRKIGKEVMLGMDWEGEMDLSDPDTMKRFNRYVRR